MSLCRTTLITSDARFHDKKGKIKTSQSHGNTQSHPGKPLANKHPAPLPLPKRRITMPEPFRKFLEQSRKEAARLQRGGKNLRGQHLLPPDDAKDVTDFILINGQALREHTVLHPRTFPWRTPFRTFPEAVELFRKSQPPSTAHAATVNVLAWFYVNQPHLYNDIGSGAAR
ncbi:hypothetical protein BV898_01012 [Hypsibius exemplaris]|uniref:Uncharacterized protein n=1 Tax=Hypsibius exemplaris TaxID=2072580 RepID=A0A1W0XDD9_HYPEX|nr:hypothetical protein BV898_01012 [Hypsibius exemplaris]